jgi:AbrB family looped-hinge helix DNA binding protein
LGQKGTIPKELREKYHLLEGEDVIILALEEGILIKHARSSLRGRLRGKINMKGFEEETKQIRSQWRL